MINCNHISYSFGKHQVLKDLNWSLFTGKIYGLLGKNGAGKSTLLQCMCGLIYPGTGTIGVFDHEPRNKTPAFKSEIFLVPENFYLPDLPIPSLLTFHQSIYPNFDPHLFNQIINDFELDGTQHWKKLSMGQKKKLLIAFGIAARTKVLLFDEPTNGLDIPAKEQFAKVLSRTLDRRNIVVISTHHIKDVEYMLDHISILDAGQIKVDMSLDELSQKFTISTYLDTSSRSLYQEKTLTGSRYLVNNDTGREGAIDIEMFYRAYHRSEHKRHFTTKIKSHESI